MNDDKRISSEDRKFLDEAFLMAQKAIDNNEVPVGCVLVHSNQVIARGHNDVNRTKNPTKHAEMCALEELKCWCKENGKDLYEVIKETTIYVTLEPCIMCACALYYLRLKRIVYGAANDRFGGLASVADRSKYESDHTIIIDQNVDRERAIQLLKQFYETQNPFCPLEKRKLKKPKKNDGDVADNDDTTCK
ncbi:unnamed protein product, partial [Anisakis simplex]|uniref:tRNA-specific adenosine deaminase 2 (inferred by orthology to a human protein) n=1 Tax=Anisakis simplex TaxID=6269 RepID=A0A0M3JJY7_ANISI